MSFHCLAAWSLLQVLDLFDYKTVLLALRSHLTVLLIVYARLGAAALIKKPEDFWMGETVDQAAWDKIIQEAIPQEFESHIYKVCSQEFKLVLIVKLSNYLKLYSSSEKVPFNFKINASVTFRDFHFVFKMQCSKCTVYKSGKCKTKLHPVLIGNSMFVRNLEEEARQFLHKILHIW